MPAFYDRRVVSEVIEARPEQQALVGTEPIVLQDEIGVADGEVVRIDLGNGLLLQRLGGDDETVDREHDAAKPLFERMVGIAGNDDEIRGHGTVRGFDARFVSLDDVRNGRVLADDDAERCGRPSLADTEVQRMQMAVAHVQ